MGRHVAWGACLVVCVATASIRPASADDRQDACKKAMNARIQLCTDECTSKALSAVPEYRDTNNNVKFGCLKRCAVNEIFTMQGCRDGGRLAPSDPTETNTR